MKKEYRQSLNLITDILLVAITAWGLFKMVGLIYPTWFHGWG